MNTATRDAGAFLLVAALFGSTFAAVKTGLADLPSLFYAGLRFDVAVVALFAGLLAWGVPIRPTTRGDVGAIVASGVFVIAANNGLLFLGQRLMTPGGAAVLYGLTPFLTPVFALWLLDDEGFPLRGVAALVLGLAGVAVIVQPSTSAWAAGGGVGEVIVLAAAVAVTLGSVLIRRSKPSMGTVPMAAWAMLIGAVSLHATSWLVGEAPALAGVSSASWLSLAWLAIPGTAIAYPLYFQLLDRVGAIRSSLVTYVVPVFATLGGWLVLGETVGLSTVGGFAIIVAGFGVLQWPTLRASVEHLLRRSGVLDASATQDG